MSNLPKDKNVHRRKIKLAIFSGYGMKKVVDLNKVYERKKKFGRVKKKLFLQYSRCYT